LRDSVWGAPCPTDVSTNPLWKQVHGITVALKKIIHFTDPSHLGRVLFGYHLDLKGQNILVDSSADILKITDFGQTIFVHPSLQSTNVNPSFAVTDAYAPPEYPVYTPDSVWDIWSLGIIVLEILAYATRGTQGLLHAETGLDIVRRTRDEHQANSRFYIGTGDSAQLKPAIENWMTELATSQDAPNRPFVERLLRLIKQMLEPQRRNRISIDGVVSEMTVIFNVASSEAIEISIKPRLEPNEVVLVNLRYVI
jgi:serine/threonine protein kinase